MTSIPANTLRKDGAGLSFAAGKIQRQNIVQ